MLAYIHKRMGANGRSKSGGKAMLKKVTDTILYVGANDHDVDLFEDLDDDEEPAFEQTM